MIWLTWRQHRSEALLVGVALALLAALLIASGNEIATTFRQLGLGNCLADNAPSSCGSVIDAFRQEYQAWPNLMPWLSLVPLLVAMLIGAPVVARELEHGTHRLVWTQGVTRLRWIAVKLALILCAALVLAVALTALLTWWRGPWDLLDGRFAPSGFDVEGIAPLSYMVFGLALAITAGTLLRRTIPAMVATLVGFPAVRLSIVGLVRPYYRPPFSQTWDPSLTNPRTLPGRADWIISNGWVDHHGNGVDLNRVFSTCAPGQGHIDVSLGTPFTLCTHAQGWLSTTTWQPADRFWLFQGIESAIFFGLAAALLALAIWWVRRRLA